MIRPWMKWYPRDWRADPRLRMCSLAARGLWIELIGFMHEAEPYGHLTINGKIPTLEDMAALVGRPLGEVRKALAELRDRQVFSVEEGGAMFSRRMVRDKAKAEADAQNGKGGGNPKLRIPDKVGVNPPDKAHMPEAREPEKKDAEPNGSGEEPSGDEKKDLFLRAKKVLGPQAGGLVAKLLRANGGEDAPQAVPKSRAAIEMAAARTGGDCKRACEYIGRVLAPKNGEFKLMSGMEGVV